MRHSQASPSAPIPMPAAVPPLELTLEKGLPAEEVVRRFALADSGWAMRHRARAYYLLEIESRGLHQLYGCRTAVQFAAVHFGVSQSEARDLLRVGRALEALTRIDQAFTDKRLCWSKVREIVRVATPETEGSWLEMAQRTSIDEPTLAVQLSKPGEKPRTPDQRRGLPEPRLKLSARLPPDVHAKWEQTKARLNDLAGRPLREWECLDALCDLGLSLREDGTVPGKTASDESTYTVVVTQAAGADGAWAVETESGLVAIDAMTADMAACDGCCCQGGHDPDRAEHSIPRRMRKRIRARDGHRCRCCKSRLSLQLHHARPRSQGGPTVDWNLVTVCRMCHALIHGRLIMVSCLEKDGRKVGFRFEDRHGHRLQGPDAVYRSLVDQLDESIVRLGTAETPIQTCGATHCVGPAGSRQRPARFADIVGQRPVVAALQTAVAAARDREQPLGHLLLSGAAGLGKTTIAHAVASELEARLHSVSAADLDTPQALKRHLARVGSRDVLLVDEIHGVTQWVAESLYEALDTGRFTLIGATTEPGMLSAQFLSRFEHRQCLDFYDGAELGEIVRRAAERDAVPITADACLALARVSRGTAREALRLFRRAVEVAHGAGSRQIDAEGVVRTLRLLEIDDFGLGPVDRRCLRVLRTLGITSARRLAALVGIDVRSYERDHEPYLLRLGLIAITPHGRMAVNGTCAA